MTTWNFEMQLITTLRGLHLHLQENPGRDLLLPILAMHSAEQLFRHGGPTDPGQHHGNLEKINTLFVMNPMGKLEQCMRVITAGRVPGTRPRLQQGWTPTAALRGSSI